MTLFAELVIAFTVSRLCERFILWAGGLAWELAKNKLTSVSYWIKIPL